MGRHRVVAASSEAVASMVSPVEVCLWARPEEDSQSAQALSLVVVVLHRPLDHLSAVLVVPAVPAFLDSVMADTKELEVCPEEDSVAD